MELSKEVRELYRNAREEICCDECLSKDSNICPCNEVVRLRRLVDDVVKVERERFLREVKEGFCLATCKGHPHRSTCTSLGTCNEYDEFCAIIRKVLEKGGNENERQIES